MEVSKVTRRARVLGESRGDLMSDNRKYYYLKLKDNFYESEEMVILQSMPDGYIYSDILMKLYLKSLKSEGRLMLKEHIPYSPEMLATVVRHPVALVKEALMIFKNLGLVEVLDNGAIFMLEIQNFIGKSSTEGDRKRAYRKKIESEKVKLLPNGQMSDIHKPEIELDIEKEIEIEKEKKKSTKKKPANADFTSLISSYTTNENLIETLNAFVEMRISIKAKPTERAFKMILNKLDKLAQTDEEKKLILENSIMNNWKDVYELKIKNQRGYNNARPVTTNGNYDSSGLELL